MEAVIELGIVMATEHVREELELKADALLVWTREQLSQLFR